MLAGLLASLNYVTAAPAPETDNGTAGRDDSGVQGTQTVLYQGPLTHERDWKLTRGTTNTDVFRGNCSMIPGDVTNLPMFSVERVVFEATPKGLDVWDMAWVDTVYGRATGNGKTYRYTYQQRLSFTAPTIDGRAPIPNRGTPVNGQGGFLQFTPRNVLLDYLENHDFFSLRDEQGNLVANSHVLWTFRSRTTPGEPPPAFFPYLVEGLILAEPKQLSGQLGCDPL